jgi:hypothetical protein
LSFAGADELKRRVGYSAQDTCPLGKERSQGEKPASVPSQRAVRERLAPPMLQTVCDILMVDFVCLGYSLPPGCELQRGARRGWFLGGL